MIKSFAQAWLEEFWHNGRHKRVPPELVAQLLRKMDVLHRARALKDISSPPSNRLHSSAATAKASGLFRSTGHGNYAFSVKTATL
ncbi:MAG: type II toxin-antitoxin system RelE/ParE family toxin [Deltaproteobacteria bacterium]|nr:type II toxin-antitoxin system RelE/ParE family toxin [Deltaproteobacteria bacterium]